VGTHNLKSRKALLQDVHQSLNRSRRATIKEMAPPGFFRRAANFDQKIGAIHPGHVLKTGDFSHPDHRHTIRCIKKRSIENRTKFRIRLRLRNAVNSRYANVAPLSRRHGLAENFDGRLEVDCVDTDAENVNS